MGTTTLMLFSQMIYLMILGVNFAIQYEVTFNTTNDFQSWLKIGGTKMKLHWFLGFIASFSFITLTKRTNIIYNLIGLIG